MLAIAVSNETRPDSKATLYHCQAKSKVTVDPIEIFPRILEALGAKNAPEAAKLLNISKQAVYDWQKNTPSIENLLKISKSRNTSLHWILTGEGSKFVSSPEFDLERSVELHDDWREVMDDWFTSEGREMPDTLGASFMGGWNTLSKKERIEAIKDFKMLLDKVADE